MVSKAAFHHLQRGFHMKTPETCTSNKKKLHCWCFPMNFVTFLRKNFLQNISARLLLDFFHSLSCFFATQLTNRNQVFSIFEHVLSQLSNVIIIIISNIMNFQFTLLCETDDPVVAAGKQFLLQAFLTGNRN